MHWPRCPKVKVTRLPRPSRCTVASDYSRYPITLCCATCGRCRRGSASRYDCLCFLVVIVFGFYSFCTSQLHWAMFNSFVSPCCHTLGHPLLLLCQRYLSDLSCGLASSNVVVLPACFCKVTVYTVSQSLESLETASFVGLLMSDFQCFYNNYMSYSTQPSTLCGTVKWVPAKGRWCSAAGKVTAGLVESNDSLPPGGWPAG